MTLRNKRIILISSERWGKIFISKHNYAIALAERGNTVFFLNPIDLSLRPGTMMIEESGVHPHLKIITYRPFFPLVLKFHLRPVFEFLIRINIRRIIKKFAIRPDIVWDFNCAYLYNDLSIFGAPFRIYNPVDTLAPDAVGKKADIVISISDLILAQYSREDVPKLRLNHGLGGPFLNIAREKAADRRNERIRVGYVGNLTLDSIDREILLRIIRENKDVLFNLVGPVSGKNNNLGLGSGDHDISSLLDELNKMENVTLHGVRPQSEIPGILAGCDILLACYKRTRMFNCDNSHKIIEYLSSGKVVVSTHLSSYEGNDLVEMSPAGRNDQLPALFGMVVKDLDKYNSPEIQQRRKAFALENTYEGHLSRIESFIGTIAAK
jgi:glycosyltransferase involved in cell wall biosynthesis